MIDWLDENQPPHFPPASQALEDPDGLLAVGANYQPDWLMAAYQRGIFPWPSDGLRLWWSPAPRAVILPETFRIPRSVSKAMRRSPYLFTSNLAFANVMTACAETHETNDGSTWIEPEMIQGYHRLAKAGYGLSVECWRNDGTLAGGFYGVRIGHAYFGESMFSVEPDTSKVAFAVAAKAMIDNGIKLIDCQMKTEHMNRFGITELPRSEFEQRLHQAVQCPQSAILPTVLQLPRSAS